MRITSPHQARAISRHVRVSPYKARQVAQGLRGLSVDAAQRQLTFSPKGAARPVLKTLNSAIANAENNQDLDAEDLFVLEVTVDEGPTLKRFQPRAMGRAYRIRKRTSHIAVVVGLPRKSDTAGADASAPTAKTATKASAKKTSSAKKTAEPTAETAEASAKKKTTSKTTSSESAGTPAEADSSRADDGTGED